ncbi:MAG: hypothetical protein V4731_08660 [Pseudomonadota bacterium]
MRFFICVCDCTRNLLRILVRSGAIAVAWPGAAVSFAFAQQLMRRLVQPETLDSLPVDDPRAERSRRDLQRVHRVMGTVATVLPEVSRLLARHDGTTPYRILELGAGDGSLMLRVARKLASSRHTGSRLRVKLDLLDQQDLVSQEARGAYAQAGWEATALVTDVFRWTGQKAPASSPSPAQGEAQAPAEPVWDLICCHLFLHHFEGPQLSSLLDGIALRTRNFYACEPRRSALALAGSHLVGAIGANAVTREDAVLSVHAGFSGKELSALWTCAGPWKLAERRAGLFSHVFSATRQERGA